MLMKRLKYFFPLLLLAALVVIGCYKVLNMTPRQIATEVINPKPEIKTTNHTGIRVQLQNKVITSQFVQRRTDSSIISIDHKAIPHLAYKWQGNVLHNGQQTFPEQYAEVPGVLTFRGNHLRDEPSYGSVPMGATHLKTIWESSTSNKWGGGIGWTGQPAIVKWDSKVLQTMNVKSSFKNDANFVEVIYASLDGNIYFFDLKSGRPSRPSIQLDNPIRGSVSIDPRGYPLLYVGDGLEKSGKGSMGLHVFSLIDGKQLSFIKGLDRLAARQWGAFDGSPLINRQTDTMFVGGENGLFYEVKLNTLFSPTNKTVSIRPQMVKYYYKVKGNWYFGIGNSVASYKNLAFFADNGGSIQALNLLNHQPVWATPRTDATNSTLVVDVEGNQPFLYTGNEVDKQGKKGTSTVKKINAVTGQTVWATKYPAMSIKGKRTVNGGVLATPINGKEKIKHLVIYTVARTNNIQSGAMVALDKKTGKEVWRWNMPAYSWSSPAAVYDKEGNAFIVQGDSKGNVYLLSAATGKILSKVALGANIEGSPAIYNQTLVVGTRGGKIAAVQIQP